MSGRTYSGELYETQSHMQWLQCSPCCYRQVHSVCSWDEKASVKIQKSLETEILTFISDANKVGGVFN